MLTLRSRVAALALAVLVVLPLAGFTLGDPPAGCQKWDEATSTCLIEVEVPADPQDPPQDGGDTDPVSGGEPDPCLDWSGKEVEPVRRTEGGERLPPDLVGLGKPGVVT